MRSSTGRRFGISRGISLKPVGLPMYYVPTAKPFATIAPVAAVILSEAKDLDSDAGADCHPEILRCAQDDMLRNLHTGALALCQLIGPCFDFRLMLQHAAVIGRHYLDEPAELVFPVVEDGLRLGAAGELVMVLEQRTDRRDVFGLELLTGFELDHFLVAQLREHRVVVVDVRDSAAHAGGEVSSGRADDHDAPAGHVFATMIADAFHHRTRAGVSNAESLADHAANVDLAGDRAVADHV